MEDIVGNSKTLKALEGIKVIETATALAGPMAGRFLADWGADVIHVEHAVKGDQGRSSRNSRSSQRGKMIVSDIDYGMLNNNRNKRSMSLNLSKELGREIIYLLVEKSDIFISNFRPYELIKFGLEYETLKARNPRIICANVSSFGQKGPDRDLPAYEHTAFFARSGLLHVLQVPGGPPPCMGTGQGDYAASLALAMGILAALFSRERTGVGQKVETSLFQVGVYLMSFDIAGSLVTGQDRPMLKREDYPNALINVYQTKDNRWLQLALAVPDPYWPKLCRALGLAGLEDDPRFASFQPRIDNHVELYHVLQEAFLTRTLEEWKRLLTMEGVIWAPLNIVPEVCADAQARANDFFTSIEHPIHGRIEVVANPVQLSATPSVERMIAPEFGQHTEEVLLESGYTWEDIQRFKEAEAIV